MPRLQVVVAHPDDETFGCGSLLLEAAAAGADTAVVCATRGEQGGTTDDLGVVRERELREAAAALGVSRVDLLDFADSGMSGEAAAGALVSVPFDDVVAAVRTPVARFRPDVLVTLDASDSHRDHVRIRDAALVAAEAVGIPRVYLVCLPRSLMRRWVDHVKVARPDMEHLDADVAALGTPDDEITTVVDVAVHLPARDRAMALHASQTSPFEGLPEDLRRAFLATDHLRRVVPAWPGGERENCLFPAGGRHRCTTDPEQPRHRHSSHCWWQVDRARWACEAEPAH
jgi:LmbE family N-acetylglucosaminyl deacetylase